MFYLRQKNRDIVQHQHIKYALMVCIDMLRPLINSFICISRFLEEAVLLMLINEYP